MGHPGESLANATSVMDITEQPENANINPNFRILSAAEKKECINIYRKVYDNVKGIDEKAEEFTEMMDKLTVNINNQNEALQQVGVNELMAMDARSMSMASQLSYGLVKKFHTESKFEFREFHRRLRMQVLKNSRKSGLSIRVKNKESGRICLEQLFGTGLAFSSASHLAPITTRSFKPPVEDETPKETKERRKPRQAQTTQTTQPTQYDSTNMANEVDESEKRLRHIHRTLKRLQKRQPNVPLVQAALNPTSFCTTVENFFNISFLARQTKIGLEMPEEGEWEPVVKTFDEKAQDTETATTSNEQPEPPQEEGTENRRNIQSILSFDQDTYQALIASLEIQRPAF